MPAGVRRWRRAGGDRRHADEMIGRQPLVQEERAEQDRRHRDQERHQHQVDRSGPGEDAVVDDVGQRGRQRPEADQRRPGAGRRGASVHGRSMIKGERNHDGCGGGDLTGGGGKRRQPAA